MSLKVDKTEKLNVQLKGESADKFKRIKAFLGLEQDTEVIRSLITWYFNQHEKELTGPPKSMWHLNLSNDGVLIWDPDLHKAVHIFFKPEGIKCTEDSNDSCKHIQFAVSQKEVQTIIRKRRKEGWKLPEV